MALSLDASLGQFDEYKQLNADDLASAGLQPELTSDPATQFVIPDLGLISENEESHEESDTQPSVSLDSDDVFKELGELRFAEED